MQDRTCAVDGCDRPVRTRGWCNMHYQRVCTMGEPGPVDRLPKGTRPRPAAERFWEKVEKTDTCWLWTGGVMKNGYGALFSVDRDTRTLPHRFAFEQANGPIAPGLDIDHICHVRRCVNPAHLQAVSRTKNNENRGVVNRNSTTGVRGVSLDKARGMYEVYAMHNRRKHSGGRYKTLAEAEAAAVALRNRLMTNNLLDRAS